MSDSKFDVPVIDVSAVHVNSKLAEVRHPNQSESFMIRVINASGKARYSCPLFYDPNVATDITPLASCISGDNPAQF